MSLTPFVGMSHTEDDFNNLCDEMGVDRYIENEDISWKMRDTKLLAKLRSITLLRTAVRGARVGMQKFKRIMARI